MGPHSILIVCHIGQRSDSHLQQADSGRCRFQSPVLLCRQFQLYRTDMSGESTLILVYLTRCRYQYRPMFSLHNRSRQGQHNQCLAKVSTSIVSTRGHPKTHFKAKMCLNKCSSRSHSTMSSTRTSPHSQGKKGLQVLFLCWMGGSPKRSLKYLNMQRDAQQSGPSRPL